MRPLYLFVTLVLVAGAATAAPVPPPARKAAKVVRADGPPTADDLRRVRWLHWGDRYWPLTLEVATGEGYVCRHHDPDTLTLWQGACHLLGDEVVLEESSYRLRPDAPAEHLGGPWEQRLRVSWMGGRLVGTGWSGPVELLADLPEGIR